MALLRPGQIQNPWPSDYHMHTCTFSDGLNTIEEVVQYAGKIGLEVIAITDHSEVSLEALREQRGKFFGAGAWRDMINRWENVHNNVQVIWGVEGDLLNEEGDICDFNEAPHTAQGEILILSAHHLAYQGSPKKITQAYLKALERHNDKIDFIGHPSFKKTSEHLDMERLCRAANAYRIPLELNGSNLQEGKLDMDKLRIMLEHGDHFMVNSDAHSLVEMRDARKNAFEFLRDEGYLSRDTYSRIAERHNWS
ncbi:PHP domain-containing protein [Candidatus Woesearchaeota archaeon]|nr:PHP domain-containing protein [Candidatus Woesearchaeota archaeon]